MQIETTQMIHKLQERLEETKVERFVLNNFPITSMSKKDMNIIKEANKINLQIKILEQAEQVWMELYPERF